MGAKDHSLLQEVTWCMFGLSNMINCSLTVVISVIWLNTSYNTNKQ